MTTAYPHRINRCNLKPDATLTQIQRPTSNDGILDIDPHKSKTRRTITLSSSLLFFHLPGPIDHDDLATASPKHLIVADGHRGDAFRRQ
mmetsp:Transcript_1160/g.2529  ORF Transcript_1160/g.2529 Transcript_1160/m.2529 type:complete len:89 (+) Transcript_1160:318-584(+)